MSSRPIVLPRNRLPTDIAGPRSTGWWGMVILILNEAVLFASLLASYFYLRFNSPIWPLAGIDRPSLLHPGIGAIILIVSSVFMVLGEAGIKKGNQWQLRICLLIAFVLGLLFLAIQAFDYYNSEFPPTVNAYSSLFFTVTGIHGLHVVIATFLNLIIQIRAWLGHFNEVRYQGVTNVSLYWHFVDVVWIFVFCSLYLSTYL